MVYLSHTSFLSSTDENGFRHSLSIDPRTICKGNGITTYEGKAKSVGGFGDPKHLKIMQITFTENKFESSQEWTNTQVEKSTIAKTEGDVFNAHIQQSWETPRPDEYKGTNRNINFVIPQIAQLDNVSSLTFSLNSPKRKKYETFIAHKKLRDSTLFVCAKESAQHSRNKTTKWNGNKFCHEINSLPIAVAGSKDTSKWDFTREMYTNVPYKELHAFIHHAYHQCKGEMIFDRLEGKYSKKKGYLLKVPTIHSIDGRFGHDDEGFFGIQRVIMNHMCTHLCQHLPEMTTHDIIKEYNG